MIMSLAQHDTTTHIQTYQPPFLMSNEAKNEKEEEEEEEEKRQNHPPCISNNLSFVFHLFCTPKRRRLDLV